MKGVKQKARRRQKKNKQIIYTIHSKCQTMKYFITYYYILIFGCWSTTNPCQIEQPATVINIARN